MRVRSIDVFRGLGIVSMVFFTLIVIFSDNLPDLLAHNEPGSIHIGDFVLPIFLFASGMSLVFYDRKHSEKGGRDYALDVIERAGRLAIVWVFISPFSSGETLGMDEIILSVLLFIPSLILLRIGKWAVLIGALVPIIAYIVLYYSAALPDFSAHYLGGFPAALFYLPVMLAGVMAGQSMGETGNWKPKNLIIGAMLASAILLLLIPPYKNDASPSFMALSVLVSLIIFSIIWRIDLPALGYLGREPLRYWILMFVLLIIPIGFYLYATRKEVIGMDWPLAVALALPAMALLYLASAALDRLAGLRQRFKGKMAGIQ